MHFSLGHFPYHFTMKTTVLLAALCSSAYAARPIDIPHPLGSHAGFPVSPAKDGGPTYTYMSVEDPEALNLDGSIYGIAVCLSTVSKANWTFSTDGVRPFFLLQSLGLISKGGCKHTHSQHTNTLLTPC